MIGALVDGEIAAPDLGRMIAAAYAPFRHPSVAPLVQIGDNLFVLELFHGPTLAFKDVAMRLLAQLMDHALKARGGRATIVGATSGDTGSAAVDAFTGLDQVDVFILFPHGRVSDVQRRQMTTVDAANVQAIAVDGTFDDCQALVKAMFNHAGFRDALQLSGVNSINWARIAAQTVYYFTAAVALGAPHRPVSFSVPTGNFGDVLAGFVAKRMGLPIERLMVATNANDILDRALTSGRYEIRGVTPTTSPSMDIQVSSNFERLLFEAHEPRCRRGARAHGGPVAVAFLRDRARAARPHPPGFRLRGGRRGDGRAGDAAHLRRRRATSSTRTRRSASTPAGRSSTTTRARRSSRCRPPIRRNSPTPSCARRACGRSCRRISPS